MSHPEFDRFTRGVGVVAALTGLLGCSDRGGPESPALRLEAFPADEGVLAGIWFEDALAGSGIDFVHDSGHRKRHLFPEIACGGAALLDVEGDGDLDVYLVQSGSLLRAERREPNRLYTNDGRARFADATARSGAGDRGYGMGVAAGDADGDGDTDLYVTNFEANALLRNEGAGRFTDVTEAAGVAEPRWSTSAAFFDPDRDGDLDLFVANYVFWTPADEITCERSTGKDYCGPQAYDAPAPDALYRNEGAGRFTDVSFQSGLRTAFGNGLGVLCSDLDGDGWQDVYVANDLTPNQLWINRRDGTFVDDGLLAGVALDDDGRAKAGMGVASGDLDGDDDEDLLIVNLYEESDSLYLNEGGYFLDRAEAAGLAPSRRFTRFGCAFVDFDQDGELDLYEANGRVYQQAERHAEDPYAEVNVVFRGLGGGRFEELLPRGGTRVPVVASSRAAAFGDLDGDGAVDVLVANRDGAPHLLLNRAPARGTWIAFRVRERSGADALGAVVRIEVEGRTRRGDVRAASSYLASNDPRVHFGLGAARAVGETRVTWVDGALESFGAREAGSLHELRRGAGRAVESR